MSLHQGESDLTVLQQQCKTICDIAKTAGRNRQSLSGHNFYGNKFHDAVVEVAKSERALLPLLVACQIDEGVKSRFLSQVAVFKDSDASVALRTRALKELKFVCETEILPCLKGITANPIPDTEQVLALAVVQGTGRSYLEKIILQANGCYEHQWYDACSVMVRRFIETLIIELYEAKGRTSEIKDAGGDFLTLKHLIDKVVAEPAWNLGRETKRVLPKFKTLGDRSAHNRHYVAVKKDIDDVTDGLRVTADTLLRLSGLK